MIKLLATTALALTLNGTLAWGAPFPVPSREIVYDTVHQMFLSPDEFSLYFVPSDVIVMGEHHATEGNKTDAGIQIEHGNQNLLLEFLGQRGLSVSVGMEFFEYTQQPFINEFLQGKLKETDFLAKTAWGGNPFEFYREQVLHPVALGGTTLGLNIPRSISAKVSQNGADTLTLDDRALLPPIWERGSDLYFERFSDIMGGHVKPEKLENYFLAQSLWDDTMAWNVAKHLKYTQDVIMVIVGEFHAEFGHGLPNRLKRHGVNQVRTVLQMEVDDFEDKTLQSAVKEDPKYGPRAEFIWLFQR